MYVVEPSGGPMRVFPPVLMVLLAAIGRSSKQRSTWPPAESIRFAYFILVVATARYILLLTISVQTKKPEVKKAAVVAHHSVT